MAPTRFDALAKSFTASTSRRAALAGLIAGLAAFAIPEREAQAKRRQRRDTKNPEPRCASRWQQSGRHREEEEEKEEEAVQAGLHGEDLRRRRLQGKLWLVRQW